VKDHTLQPLRFYRPDQLGRGSAPAAAGSAPVATGGYTAAAPAGGSIVAPGSPTAVGTLPGGSRPGLLGGLFGGGSSDQPGPGGVLAGSGQSTRGGLIVSQMDNREGVWYGPRMEGKPVGVEVGDLDGDGKNEVALGFKDRIVVARVVAGKFEPVADYAFGRSGEALSLDGLDLDGNGRMELYVTLAQLNDIRSSALELQGGQLAEVVKSVPFFLRKVKLGGEGYVLLGQDLNPDLKNHTQDLAGPIFRVTRSGDRLERGAPVDLPSVVSLHGFQSFEHSGRPLLARININDKLQVMEPTGGLLWESSDYFGGSETSFERPDGMAGGTTRYAFLPPRIEPGPDGTVLVPVNEGSRTFSAFRSFNSSHLKAVTFDGYSLVERWRTKPQGGYLGDFRMADADNDGAPEIVMLVMFSHGNWVKTSSGNTALLIYEMQ
ncbi:MAG: FG-GAP repeat domain-containing protein, partial [Desulfuromonadales bacterium]